jgi:hypothetical protein
MIIGVLRLFGAFGSTALSLYGLWFYQENIIIGSLLFGIGFFLCGLFMGAYTEQR